jgi:hypothetical protein
MMGPLWDFDAIMGTSGWDYAHYYLSYFNLLFNSENDAFRKAYTRRWKEIKDSVFVNLYEYLAHFSMSSEGLGFDSSIAYHNERWKDYHNGLWEQNFKLKPVETYLNEAQSFFDKRKQWLEDNIVFEPELGDTITVGDVAYRVTCRVPGAVEFISTAETDTVVIASTIISDKWRYSVTSIASGAFENAEGITSIKIPNTVTSIESGAFSGCTAVTAIRCMAQTPPTCGNMALDDINKQECVLYVPKGCVEDYRSADQWKEFFSIEEDDMSDSIRGDVNGDGFVNGTDIQAIINFIVESQYDEKADVNSDDVVNGTDIQEVINIIVNGE